MVSVPFPPDLSVPFLLAILLPLIVGFIVGVIIKKALKIGIIIAVILLIVIVLGLASPSQILAPILSFWRSGSALTSFAERIAGYLPYSSIAFVIGAIIGFLKG
ncbi:MAG: hypothetical protein HY296_02725 [Thaumarchaeota archaeon]|nr:hypothetical protein [Nitrososphaerota archaeon]